MQQTTHNLRGHFLAPYLIRSIFGSAILLAAIALHSVPVTAQTPANDAAVQLYFFTNAGCAPCRQVEPGITALAQEGYPVTTVVLSEHPDWGKQFSVSVTPTVILVANNKVVGRHAGLIDGVTLKEWFAAVGVPAGNRFSNQVGGTKVSLESQPAAASQPAPTNSNTQLISQPATQPPSTFASSSTVHEGTRQPESASEERALKASVRLKVEDPEGISYATGTVIHCHDGEWLVLTCGHVFRESEGRGKITAEFGFGNGEVKSAPCQLISYDADARDIGLVAVQAGMPIDPVSIGNKNENIDRGQVIFSIGCDQGDVPTIRRSKIKNRAAYDGAIKYDIFGRPVNGRSGGGLFNDAGELIGVCNAAAVEEDEGIYTALETVHWQIAKVKLEHLFDGPKSVDQPERNVGIQPISANPRLAMTNAPAPTFAAASISAPQRNPVAWDNAPVSSNALVNDDSDREVIIIVRSKSNPSRAEAITVSHPSPQLLEYLGTMQDSSSGSRQLDVAQLRTP